MPGSIEQETLTASPLASSLNFSDGVTKYITESRTSVEVKGRRGKKLGGWDKIKDAGALQTELNDKHFMELIRYKSGKNETEKGYILAERHLGMSEGITGELKDGTWTVVIKRPLKSDQKGSLDLALDQVYNFGFAIHDDYSNARYHHVSVGYKLGFDNDETEIDAIAQ
jgi:cytochrome c-type protein NapC